LVEAARFASKASETRENLSFIAGQRRPHRANGGHSRTRAGLAGRRRQALSGASLPDWKIPLKSARIGEEWSG